MINFPTRNSSLLDLIITNSPNGYKNITYDPPLGNSDHLVIIGYLKSKNEECLIKTFTEPDFLNADHNSISNCIMYSINK